MKRTKKQDRRYRTENGTKVLLGIVPCSGTLITEPHDTYGPLDGRPVLCFECGTGKPVNWKSFKHR